MLKVSKVILIMFFPLIAYCQNTIEVIPALVEYNVIEDYRKKTESNYLHVLGFYINKNDSLIIKKLMRDFGQPKLHKGTLVWIKILKQGWKDKDIEIRIQRGAAPEIDENCIAYFTIVTTLKGKDLLRPLSTTNKEIRVYLNGLISQIPMDKNDN